MQGRTALSTRSSSNACSQFATDIIASAALSYLGLGTQLPMSSWGRMLNKAQTRMFQAPQRANHHGVAIALAVLGLNLMGDGVRDLLDPKLARRRRACQSECLRTRE